MFGPTATVSNTKANPCNSAFIHADLVNLAQTRVNLRGFVQSCVVSCSLARFCAILRGFVQSCAILCNLARFRAILRGFVQSRAVSRNLARFRVISRGFAQSRDSVQINDMC